MKTALFIILLSALSSCMPSELRIQNLVQDQINSTLFDPDQHIVDIHPQLEEGLWKIKGTTSLPQVKSKLEKASQEYGLNCQITLLPDTIHDSTTYGIVNLSTISLHKKPDQNSPMITQSLLGTPVRILLKKDWYLIRTPSQHLGWCPASSIEPMSKTQFQRWIKCPKLIINERYAEVFKHPSSSSHTQGFLVGGNIVALRRRIRSFYEIEFPDHRIEYIAIENTSPLHKLKGKDSFIPKNIIQNAKLHLGIPYLCHGSSFKGLDDIGLLISSALLSGVIIPYQLETLAYTGKKITPNKERSNLQPGDFLFFGITSPLSKLTHIEHTGIYLGNQEFIHTLGKVTISSLDPHSNSYNETYSNKLLWATHPYQLTGQSSILEINQIAEN